MRGVLESLICAALCLVPGSPARAAWLAPVAIGTWETSVLIEQPSLTFPTEENRYPRVALSNSGTAVATWVGPSRNGLAPQTVFAAIKPPRAGWLPATVLAALGSNPEVAVDGRGAAMIVWGSEGNYRSAYLAAHTSKWKPALDMPTPRGAARLKLGLDAHGDAVAVWSILKHGEGEGGGVIEVAELRSGATRWTAPKRLFAETTTAHGGAEIQRRGQLPAIAVGPDGNAILLWEQTTVTTLHGRQVGNATNIESVTRSSRRNHWGAPASASPRGVFAINPHIAVDGHGNAVAAWETLSCSGANSCSAAVQSASLPVSIHRWRSPVTIARAIEIDTLVTAMDAKGEAIAVWAALPGVEQEPPLKASRRSLATGRWQPLGSIGYGTEAEVSGDGVDRAAVVWVAGFYEHRQFIQGVIRPLGSRRQVPPVEISAPQARAARPHVVANAHGQTVAVWFNRDGSVEATTETSP